jgi:hypothetical protein
MRLLLLLLLLAPAARSQSERTLPQPAGPQVEAAAHAYAAAWLLADSAAMARALHPAARRQTVRRLPGATLLEEQDYATMLAAAAALTPDPDALDRVAVRIVVLDEAGAVAYIDLPLWTERVTFVRWNDTWKVTHAAWHLVADDADR